MAGSNKCDGISLQRSAREVGADDSHPRPPSVTVERISMHKGTRMAANIPRKIFVNLPVRDLDRSIQFFSALGFTFNPMFTDAKAACMIVSDEAFVMLLTESFFKTFTHRRVCNTSNDTEGLFAVSCSSRAEVDEMVRTAVAVGGKQAMEKHDHGFMYGWSFYDLDGHHWEVIWMQEGFVRHEARLLNNHSITSFRTIGARSGDG